MAYLVTARKWRPMVFEDVVGQSHVATTLRNAVASSHLSHAYIFSGPRGVGKTTMARILAKAANCPKPVDSNPDNACEICKEITEGRSIDVLEIDGASNRGVDEIRNLRESVRYPPLRGKYKVYIIDEVHMLTKEAFNALLKTLEEPPPHILFVFATTEVHKVPATILSRCQRFDFRRISVEEIIGRLRHIADHERITIDNDALLIIAKKADGSLRDAQSIFDQVLSFGGETINAERIMRALNVVDEELYFRVTNLIREHDPKGGLALVDEIINRGYDIKEFLGGLNEHFRNMLLTITTQSTKLIETSEVYKKRYEETAKQYSDADVFRLMKITGDILSSLRWTDQPRFRLEVGLLQMIKMESSITVDELLRELEELKKRLASPGETDRGHVGTRDFRIAGSVKASPPSALSTASTRGQHPQNIFLGASPTRPVPPQDLAFPSPDPSRTRISVTPVPHDKWMAFIEAAGRQKVMVGTVLKESHCAGVADGALKVVCPDDVHLSMLRKNREYLTDLASQIYGARIHLEAIVSADATPKPPFEEHPTITALKRELGAEPVE